MRLDGRVALVTGAGRGIGAAIAARLAEAGAAVAVNDVDEQGARRSAHSIGAAGPSTLPVVADVTDASAVRAMVAEVCDAFGTLDILVNNAGVLRNAPIDVMTEGDWNAVIDVHLKGAFLCIQAAQQVMVARGFGRIVNLSSGAAAGSSRGHANYASAKAGLIGLTKTMAVELGPSNVTTNAVAPGAIVSDMTRATAAQVGLSFDEYIRLTAERIPLRRVGRAEEVADVVCFLASDAARYINGEVIFVGGGPGPL